MRTPYTVANGELSNKAHLQAQKSIYPQVFNTPFDDLRFEDTVLDGSERNGILDGEMGIDRIIKVSSPKWRGDFTFTIQERFRRFGPPKNFERWRDITVTEWNNYSGLPSELYKINAGLFVYGYFDEDSCKFGEVTVVNVTGLIFKLLWGDVNYGPGQNRKGQDFVSFRFDELAKSGLVMAHFLPDNMNFTTPEFDKCYPKLWRL